jgi:protein-disulfide isomerase
VIYSDFECSACRRFEEIFKKQILPLAEREGSGGARVAFKHWPISTECNYTSTRNLHPLACKAAVAASAAQQLGGDEAFWEMHDLLFETQKEWKQTGDFVSLAKRIGLDEAAFAEAMQDPALLEQIQASVAEGDQIGMDLLEAGEIDEETREAIKVGSTPAVFINGKRLKSTRHTATWLRIFRQSALNHRRAQLRERRQSSQQNAQPPQPEQPQPDAQPADEARDLETGDETSEAPQ